MYPFASILESGSMGGSRFLEAALHALVNLGRAWRSPSGVNLDLGTPSALLYMSTEPGDYCSSG